jgi:GDP-D-mannose dehydratase
MKTELICGISGQAGPYMARLLLDHVFGMVLNTSFNENEPIVDTPEQALDCFRRTDMDALCLGRFVLTKALPSP